LKFAIGILGSEALTIVAVLGIDSLGLLIEILVPELEVVGDHRVLLGEILRVGLNEVVVALKRIKRVGGKVGVKEVVKTLLQ
jgi:hypothetical protein